MTLEVGANACICAGVLIHRFLVLSVIATNRETITGCGRLQEVTLGKFLGALQ
jgi:hypothetical protein